MSVRTRLDRDFEEFVRARSAGLLRTAVLLVAGDVGHAQDLVQQALWRTHRHWGQAIDHPDAYVRKVLVNLAHDRRRNAARRVTEAALHEAASPPASDTTTALLERDALIGVLRLLPVRQRACVVLRFWDDLSVEETAAALGCSAGTVKSNTSKGVARLREILAQQAISDADTGRMP
jgi:RNA polymerase sigma-70 factor (sigma-E family)